MLAFDPEADASARLAALMKQTNGRCAPTTVWADVVPIGLLDARARR